MLQASSFKSFETFDTTIWYPASYLIYTPIMAKLDDNTEIVNDNSSNTVTNIGVKPVKDGVDIVLFHALETTGDHVDKADIVGTWHFESTKHIDDMIKTVKESLKRQK